MSKVLSIMPAPFSKAIEYEKPEHPPPTTPTRRPLGTGFCCAMISFTLAMAFGVNEIGATLAGAASGVTFGVTVVAICISLKVLAYYDKLLESGQRKHNKQFIG